TCLMLPVPCTRENAGAEDLIPGAPAPPARRRLDTRGCYREPDDQGPTPRAGAVERGGRAPAREIPGGAPGCHPVHRGSPPGVHRGPAPPLRTEGRTGPPGTGQARGGKAEQGRPAPPLRVALGDAPRAGSNLSEPDRPAPAAGPHRRRLH